MKTQELKSEKMNSWAIPGINMDSMTKIENIVCQFYSITPKDMNMKIKNRERVRCRQVCHYFSSIYTKHSLSSIGNRFGGKDHATVLHSKKTINNEIETDKNFANDILQLERMIKSNMIAKPLYMHQSTGRYFHLIQKLPTLFNDTIAWIVCDAYNTEQQLIVSHFDLQFVHEIVLYNDMPIKSASFIASEIYDNKLFDFWNIVDSTNNIQRVCIEHNLINEYFKSL